MDYESSVTTVTSHVSYNFYIGLSLAISSSLFIGSSFVIKKKGLLKLGIQGQIRASSGGYGYLKEWIWWAGLISMGIGETANFAAYAFAPASVVTPLGVLSVLVSSLLSSKFLGERLNLLGKIGCFLCVIGSTIIVLHSPEEGNVDSMERLGSLVIEPGFIVYVLFICISTTFLIFFCVPRYGSTNIVIYILICSMIGSLSVMECKGLGLALRETISGNKNELNNFLTWVCFISLICCITVQINYLNKALDAFNTSVVTPVYYVFFTTFVIFASAILFQEWWNMAASDIVGNICGFFIVINGIFLLNGFREWDISFSNLNNFMQKKEDLRPGLRSIDESENTSIFIDYHNIRNGETSNLLERHSRQNSLETRTFTNLMKDSESMYNSLDLYNST